MSNQESQYQKPTQSSGMSGTDKKDFGKQGQTIDPKKKVGNGDEKGTREKNAMGTDSPSSGNE